MLNFVNWEKNYFRALFLLKYVLIFDLNDFLIYSLRNMNVNNIKLNIK